MGVQSELLRIGGEILTHEQTIMPATKGLPPHMLWAHLEGFEPGLCILAMADGQQFNQRRLAYIIFGLYHPDLDDSEVLKVLSDPDAAGAYENEQCRYFLEQFGRYSDRPNRPAPVGLSGLALGATILNPALLETPNVVSLAPL